MSIKPVFFFTVSIAAPMGKGKFFRLIIPLPLFCFNDFVESIADIAAFLSVITFGKLKIKVTEDKKTSTCISVKTASKILYTFSDVMTELCLFTGRFDLLNVNVAEGSDRAKVRISIC